MNLDPFKWCGQAMVDVAAVCANADDLISKAILEIVAKGIERAQHFLVPEYGRFFEEGTWINWEGVEVKLPYPFTVIQYACPEIEPGTGEPSTKRIVLAMNQEGADTLSSTSYQGRHSLRYVAGAINKRYPKSSFVQEGFEDLHDFIFIWPVFYIDSIQRWIPSWVGTIIPEGTAGAYPMSPEQIARDRRLTSGSKPPQGSIHGKYSSPLVCPFLMPLFIKEGISREELTKNMVKDIGGEMHTFKQFCQVLTCENITKELVHPPPKLNKARIRRGKLPLYSYHVLVVKEDHIRTEDVSVGGHHASPRLHWRRGHIRRLEDERRIWVRPHLVGSKELGVIEKDYQVKTH